MTRIYGHKWSSIAESDDGTWLAGLQDLTPQQLSVGFGNLLQNGNEWPPSLPEFRDYCLNKIKDDNIHTSAAYTEYSNRKLLPNLKASKEKASEHREKLRELGIIKTNSCDK